MCPLLCVRANFNHTGWIVALSKVFQTCAHDEMLIFDHSSIVIGYKYIELLYLNVNK